MPDPDNKECRTKWKDLYGRIDDLLPTRNIIAHQPVRRTGTASEGKAVYVYGIYIEPYQGHLNKKHSGLKGKDELGTEDLIQHSIAVEDLENDLKSLVSTLVPEPQRRSSDNASG